MFQIKSAQKRCWPLSDIYTQSWGREIAHTTKNGLTHQCQPDRLNAFDWKPTAHLFLSVALILRQWERTEFPRVPHLHSTPAYKHNSSAACSTYQLLKQTASPSHSWGLVVVVGGRGGGGGGGVGWGGVGGGGGAIIDVVLHSLSARNF